MKKKILYSLLIFIASLAVGINAVQAKEISKDDIDVRTYIIGEHMFTRETYGEYKGQLTTQYIMLGASTINSTNVDDMIIYYKKPTGDWVNALNNTTVTPPKSFDIQYKNSQDIRSEVEVTFDFAGGSGLIGACVLVEGETIPKVDDPTRNGYAFTGWTLNGKTYDFDSIVTEDITLVANWALYGDVDFDGYVGTKDISTIYQYILKRIDLTKKELLVADVNNDSKIDYIDTMLIRMYQVGDYGIQFPYDSGKRIIVTYNLDGGSLSTNECYIYAENLLQFESYATLPTPTKEGYVFLGWTGSNGTTPQTEVIIPEGTTINLTYTANWGLYGDVNFDNEINARDVVDIKKYNLGTIEFTDEQLLVSDVDNDGEITYIDTTLLAQFILDGCKYDPEGYGVSFPFNAGTKYAITYNLNGGVLESKKEVYATKVQGVSIDEIPTKEGYVFLGWTGSNGTTPQKSIAIPKGTTGNLTYTANWEQEE